eukprot:SAG31_NODE_7542_length_1659_cov_2.091667_2_plen_46_part_01
MTLMTTAECPEECAEVYEPLYARCKDSMPVAMRTQYERIFHKCQND